ncbi:hypothetical protein [Saccharopolyspora sp. NPDC050642]|uniref:hypothetical protein n=1 Tax=Saccharopolyspora sp. NPDC050642 TaxID=3157099 RepID=UPI0033F6DD6B
MVIALLVEPVGIGHQQAAWSTRAVPTGTTASRWAWAGSVRAVSSAHGLLRHVNPREGLDADPDTQLLVEASMQPEALALHSSGTAHISLSQQSNAVVAQKVRLVPAFTVRIAEREAFLARCSITRTRSRCAPGVTIVRPASRTPNGNESRAMNAEKAKQTAFSAV